MEESAFDELEELNTLAQRILKKYDLHTSIIISREGTKIVQDFMFVPQEKLTADDGEFQS